jgi:hypothetical protein
MKRASLLFASVLLVPLLSGVVAPVYAATPPVLASSATYGVLANTHLNPMKIGTQVGIPMHLRIPSINVNAVVEQVGLTSSNTVDIPKWQRNAPDTNLAHGQAI